MTRWAKLPLKQDAVQKANEEVRQALAKDPKEDDPSRKLTMLPKDYDYRNIWMKAYVVAGGATTERPPRTPRQGKTHCAWTVTELMRMLRSCEKALELLKEVRSVHGGKLPTIKRGKESKTDFGERERFGETIDIAVDKNRPKCVAIQDLVFELANASQKNAARRVYVDAERGKLNREKFVKRVHLIEYRSNDKLHDTFAACKAGWRCGSTKPLNPKMQSFTDFYKAVPAAHKDFQRKHWDKHYEKTRRAYLSTRMQPETNQNVYGTP